MAKSIAETLIDEIFALLPPAMNIATATGRRETAKHARSPRVVAIPLGAPVIDIPDRPGDPKFQDKGRILLLRRFNIDWECHGVRKDTDTQDFYQAEQVFLATIQAVRKRCHHTVVFSNERWADQEENNDGFERYGSLIIFSSTIDIPIYEDRSVSPIVTLTGNPAIQTTVKLNDEVGQVINQGGT